MRIAFVGLPLGALLLARDGHEIVWAGICRRNATGVRRLTRLLGPARVAVVPDLARVVDEVRAHRPEILVSWFWTRKIPSAFRTVAPLGAFGVHPSLLPRHRGPDPYFWAIDSGDQMTGVTAHVIEDEYDTGAMLGARTLAIDPTWNAWTLAKRLDRPSLALLRETAAAFARGAPPTPVAQDDARATAAPEPSDEDLEIRWTWPAARIARRVRAASPWPGTFTDIGDITVAITRARPTQDYPAVLEAGEAFVRRDGVAIVRAGEDALELLAGRLEEADDELEAAGLAALVMRAQADRG